MRRNCSLAFFPSSPSSHSQLEVGVVFVIVARNVRRASSGCCASLKNRNTTTGCPGPPSRPGCGRASRRSERELGPWLASGKKCRYCCCNKFNNAERQSGPKSMSAQSADLRAATSSSSWHTRLQAHATGSTRSSVYVGGGGASGCVSLVFFKLIFFFVARARSVGLAAALPLCRSASASAPASAGPLELSKLASVRKIARAQIGRAHV